MTAYDIPVTLHDSLMARLDRLGWAKEVIQIGSVFGGEFSYELLHAVHPIAEEDLNAEILFDDPLFVVAGTNSKWVRRRSIGPAELLNETWCLPPYDTLIRSLVAEAFRARGLDIPRDTVITGSIQLSNALLATGRFLGVLSGSTLRLSGKRMSLRALPVEFSMPSSPVGIVTLKSRTISPAAQLFVECARGLARLLAAEPIRRQRRS